MPIPGSQLVLTIKDTIIVLVKSQPVIRSTYQVIAPNFDALVAESSFDQTVDHFGQFEQRDNQCYGQAVSWFISIKEWNRAQVALGDYSLHDANLTLNWWSFEPDGDDWKMSHPLSGDFSGVSLQVDESGRPTLLSRLTAIIARVLPPATWGWAESEAPEEITTHCIAVQSADSYNVYNDLKNGQFVLLGNVPDDNYRTLTGVPAGYYRIRMAAVLNGGGVGILGNENIVQVAAINGAEAFSVPYESVTLKKKSIADRIKSVLAR